MDTIVTPCRVPWAISPSESLVTLHHRETDVGPECTVILGARDMSWKGLLVEISFEFCYFTRTMPHSDSEGIESIGYKVEPQFAGSVAKYVDWRKEQWSSTGFCPDSGFYVARQSSWLLSIPELYQSNCRHYVVYGRDGHAELIAERYRWRAWKWDEFPTADPREGPIVAEGEGTN